MPAFVRLILLEATEDYRDGFASRVFGWPGKARQKGPRNTVVSGFYARSINEVAELSDTVDKTGT